MCRSRSADPARVFERRGSPGARQPSSPSCEVILHDQAVRNLNLWRTATHLSRELNRDCAVSAYHYCGRQKRQMEKSCPRDDTPSFWYAR